MCKTIVVWFSCGAASAVAARETIVRYGNRCDIRFVNNPVMEEDEDNRRFLFDVEHWLGIEIESAVNSKWPTCSATDVWIKERYMSGPYGASCTRALKKNARYEWERNNHADYMVLGFTADEVERHRRFTRSERENVLPVLIEAGLTKQDCFHVVINAGVTLPRVYKQGYPNANCIGCVKVTSPRYWNHVRENHPQVFEERSKLSRSLGCKLVQLSGKRVYLDELDPKEKRGIPLKSIDIDCGIFCEPE
jgi:hypothetical protein